MTAFASASARSAFGLCVLLILAAPAPARAQLRPDAAWREITSQHFNVVYEAGLDSLARHAAVRAEIAHGRLSSITRAPKGRIDLVLADNTDITNGGATPLPSNRIYIWVRSPVDELNLQHYHDWIDLVVTHELTHIFQLDQAGAIGRLMRTVFGRLPIGWPVLPALEMPSWNKEGLATVVESRDNDFTGRIHGSWHEMIVRTAILENGFDAADRMNGETPIWPGSLRAYMYGSLFMDYIARRYGMTAHDALVRMTAASVLPPQWRLDGIAKSALGRSFSDLYSDWRAELETGYARLADSLRAAGLTEAERITHTGRWALHPRISPNGRKLAYADENGRDVVATRIIDLATGADERIRRNGIAPPSWLNDTDFVTSQYELTSPYETRADLYLVRNGKDIRLTYGERAEAPDVSRRDGRIVYVQNARGDFRLMLRDMDGSNPRVLVDARPGVHWAFPRWSPDGTRIAAQRWTNEQGVGTHDIALIDVEPVRVTVHAMDRALDAAPAWSPDGRYVIYSSDRTGITNLFAFDVVTRQSWQITNLLGGAYYPEVSPDGAWLYYSGYHADGFHIERIRFDPATWREPGVPNVPFAMRQDTFARAAQAVQALDTTVTAARKYSALRSLRPRYWAPFVYADDALGTFLGVSTGGADDVRRHAYSAALAIETDHGRVAGALNYAWAGLGNPVINLDVLRDWDSFEREDRVMLSAAYSHRRWRASHAFIAGVEGVALTRRLWASSGFPDREDELVGVVGGIAFGNARMPALAISREDGVRASVFVRRRFELDPAASTDASHSEITASGAAYKSAGTSRFAHNVIALRASALQRTGLGRGPTDVGGVYDFLPVRGFAGSERIGFSAWTASLEYRFPLALIGRGYKMFPLFVDRAGGSFFADAGNASCSAEQRAVYVRCPGIGERATGTLASVGFEVNANIAVLFADPAWTRAGIAFPVSGGARKAQIYLTVGPSF